MQILLLLLLIQLQVLMLKDALERLLLLFQLEWLQQLLLLLLQMLRFVMVEIPAQDAANIQRQQQLKEVLRSQTIEGVSPKVAVVAKIKGASQNQLVRLGVQFRVPDESAAVAALNNAGFKAEAYGLMQNIPVA